MCLGNEKKKWFMVVLLPCCDHIIARQYADSEKEMWRYNEDKGENKWT